METSDAAEPFTEDQIIGLLREADLKNAELCRRNGTSNATFYNWKESTAG